MPVDEPSWGYPGNLTADSGKWSWGQIGLGHYRWVRNAASLLATPVQAGTRQVSLAPGRFGGAGVQDVLSAPHVVTLPAVSTGTQWFLIVARRTFGATKQTTFEVIPGPVQASQPTSAPAFVESRGSVEDQPLWLVPLSAGQTVPGPPVDLRLIGTGAMGVYQANSELVLTITGWEGMEVVIGTDRWRRGSNAAGSSVWDKVSQGSDVELSSYGSSAAGWTGGGLSSRVLHNPATGRAEIDLQVRRVGAAIVPGLGGNIGDENVFQANVAPLMPNRDVPVFGQYAGGTAFVWFPFNGLWTTGGALILQSLQEGVNLNTRPGSGAGGAVRATDISLRCHIEFTRKV